MAEKIDINFDAPKPSTAKTVAEVDQVRPLPVGEKLNLPALRKAQAVTTKK